MKQRFLDKLFWRAAKAAFKGISFRTEVSETNGVTIIRMIEIDPGREVMTVGEVADLLKMKESTLRVKTEARAQAADAHPIPFFKIGRALRFERSKITEWLKQHSEPQPRPKARRKS